jgi:hypothetical protein
VQEGSRHAKLYTSDARQWRGAQQTACWPVVLEGSVTLVGGDRGGIGATGCTHCCGYSRLPLEKFTGRAEVSGRLTVDEG